MHMQVGQEPNKRHSKIGVDANYLVGEGAYTESANFVSLRFCVLDNNIRNFMCVK
jgi:hypothetical protein